MKTFKSLSHADRCKFITFHSIHFDLNILESACKTLMSNPDPDFICRLASELDKFVQSEVFPLTERHFNDIHCNSSSSPNNTFHETDNENNNVDDNLGRD